MMDTNEHVVKGRWASMLPEAGIHLQESLGMVTKWLAPNTHINGSIPIDAVYHTPDLEVVNIKLLNFFRNGG